MRPRTNGRDQAKAKSRPGTTGLSPIGSWKKGQQRFYQCSSSGCRTSLALGIEDWLEEDKILINGPTLGA